MRRTDSPSLSEKRAGDYQYDSRPSLKRYPQSHRTRARTRLDHIGRARRRPKYPTNLHRLGGQPQSSPRLYSSLPAPRPNIRSLSIHAAPTLTARDLTHPSQRTNQSPPRKLNFRRRIPGNGNLDVSAPSGSHLARRARCDFREDGWAVARRPPSYTWWASELAHCPTSRDSKGVGGAAAAGSGDGL